jgi:hypothetical protein
MPTATLTEVDMSSAEELIERWLTDTSLDGSDSPAGPLFTGGRYVVQEITATVGGCGTRCSSCTGSRPIACC